MRHAVAAWKLLSEHNGNQYAAAITYFSFLALFPLLLLAVAVTGFVLHAHPAAQQSLFNHITTNVPGTFGTTLHSSIKTAIKPARRGRDHRPGRRAAHRAGLDRQPARGDRRGVGAAGRRKRNFFKAKLRNLLVLVGLGLGLLVSLGSHRRGHRAHRPDPARAGPRSRAPGMGMLLARSSGLLLAVLGDVVIFCWLLVRLPHADVPHGVGPARCIARPRSGSRCSRSSARTRSRNTANSPTAGPFAGLLAVLIWIQLVARWILYVVSVTAVLSERAYLHASGSCRGGRSAPVRPPEPRSRGEHRVTGGGGGDARRGRRRRGRCGRRAGYPARASPSDGVALHAARVRRGAQRPCPSRATALIRPSVHGPLTTHVVAAPAQLVQRRPAEAVLDDDLPRVRLARIERAREVRASGTPARRSPPAGPSPPTRG